MKTRMLGIVQFIGELYLQKKVKGDKSLITKNIITKSCFPTLLKDKNDDDKIESLCKLLKTIGKKFKNDDENELKRVVDEIHSLTSNKNLSQRVRISVIPDLVEAYEKGFSSDKTPKTPTPKPEQSPRQSNQNNKYSQDVRNVNTKKFHIKERESNHPKSVDPVSVPVAPSVEKVVNKKPFEYEKKEKDVIVGFWTGYIDENGSDKSIVEGFVELERVKPNPTDVYLNIFSYYILDIM